MPRRKIHRRTQSEISHCFERDEQAATALVTAGALVAIADRHVDTIERDEVVRYINDRRLVPSIAKSRIAGLFDQRARRLEQADFVSVVIEALRPVGELSLSSEVMEIAERVAEADRYVHSYELQALKLVRLITMSVPNSNVVGSYRGSSRAE